LLTNTEAESFTTKEALLEDLIFNWTGVQSIDPTSMRGHINARILGSIEATLGQTYSQKGGWGSDASPDAALILNRSFDKLKAWAREELYWQTQGPRLLKLLKLKWIDGSAHEPGRFEWDASALVQSWSSTFETQADTADQTESVRVFLKRLHKSNHHTILAAIKAEEEQVTEPALKNLLQQISQ